MNKTDFKPDHIENLRTSEPVGAVLTVGVKGERGNPVDRDRFYFLQPHSDNDRRPVHPAFGKYNSLDVVHRRAIAGNLVHATRQECFEFHLRNHITKGQPTPPTREPFCVGDGKTARRWTGDAFEVITCPHDLCQFRQTNPPTCKPFARLLFRPRWREGSTLPAPLVKLTTQSWYSISNFVGFFDHVEKQARELGVDNFSLYGLPFTLTLAEKSKPASGEKPARRFPVLTITPDGDLLAFLLAQREKIARLKSEATPVAITDASEQNADVIDADCKAIEPTPLAPSSERGLPPRQRERYKPAQTGAILDGQKSLIDAVEAKSHD